jgi:hypothetical protein
MRKLVTPSEIYITYPFKKPLGCVSKNPVRIGNNFVKVRGYLLDYHDLYHMEVSCLERIQIGKFQVSGIHGINSPILHDAPIIEEYNGFLDEVRVAIHEWLTRTSVFTTFKLIAWMLWLIAQGMNPIGILIRHKRTLKGDNLFISLAENMTFVSSKE